VTWRQLAARRGVFAVLLAGVVAGLAAGGPAAATPQEPAQRIVTLAPHLAELVHAAGAGDRLVGTVGWSNFPPAVAALPQVGDAFRVDLEALAVLDPDLVLAWQGGNPDHLLEQLAGRGYRVVALAPERLHDIGTHLEAIGRLAGTEAAATAAADAFREELATLRAAQAGKSPLRVFYQVSWRPLYTVGGRQLISEVIGLCGGRNIFADLGELAPAVSLEAVIERDPEVILTADLQRAELDAWHRWTGIAAVRDGHLYSVDGDLVVRASPRILAGVREVCARLDEVRRGPRQAGPLTRD
jgi:iron complex transport system substrate-binding protein